MHAELSRSHCAIKMYSMSSVPSEVHCATVYYFNYLIVHYLLLAGRVCDAI